MNPEIVHDLRLRAAAASGWPTLHVGAWDEATVLLALAVVERVRPCPQADLTEPWDDDDPWSLRIILPFWPEATLRDLDRALRELPASIRWAVGDLPGRLEAIDHGALEPDRVDGDPPALGWIDGLGASINPMFAEDPHDPPTASVASELVAAVYAVSPELIADRLPVGPVRERARGRRGWRVELAAGPQEDMPGDAVAALRRDVLAALHAVVERRAGSDPALAPDVLWDPRGGGSWVVWRIGPPGAAVPGDSPVTRGLHGLPAPGVGGRVHDWEIQVVPHDRDGHDGLADRLAAAAGDCGWGGGPSRWLAFRDGTRVEPVFCPTWRAERSADPRETLRAWMQRPDIAAIRVIPGLPLGLEEAAATLDPAVLLGSQRWIVRWRDGARAGDRVVATAPRPGAPHDDAAVSSLVTAFARARGPRPIQGERDLCRFIQDEHGNEGLEVRWPAALLDAPASLIWALEPLLTADLPRCAPILDLGLFSEGPRVHVWYTTEGTAPLWVSAG